MSSVRVESPRLQEFRRQPSPPIVSRMPKPGACRQLFAVDHDATDRLLEEELAKMQDESKEYGFDFNRDEPLTNPHGSSRYTEWEAVPNERVPSFYHEKVASGKPCRPRIRPAPSLLTSSHYQNSSNGSSNPALPRSTRRSAAHVAPNTASSRPSLSAQPPDLQPTKRSSTTDTSPHRRKEISPALNEHVTVSVSGPACQSCSSAESKSRDKCETEPSEGSSANNARTSTAQSKITDFMVQRKRNGSDSSSSTSSVSNPDTSGEKHAQVPAKRRRQRPASPVAPSSPTTGLS